jgi:hypothetical protein
MAKFAVEVVMAKVEAPTSESVWLILLLVEESGDQMAMGPSLWDKFQSNRILSS